VNPVVTTGAQPMIDAYDLVTWKPRPIVTEFKTRKCLRCKKEFKARDGQRTCAGCQRVNQRMSVRSSEVI